METFRRLTMEYADWLATEHGIDLAFQNFEEEMANLPGKYAPPKGAIFLAQLADGTTAGCIALRPFAEGVGEIKRLYVSPKARGHRLGFLLCEKIIAEARHIGYRRLILDTADFMDTAQNIYVKFGFSDIDAYYENPHCARHMALELT